MGWRLLLGLILSLTIGGVAYWRRALSGSGVLGAALLGTVVFGFGGWAWGGILIIFFVSSSLLSHYRSRQKAGLAEKFSKGSRRDLGQTLANGGLAGLIALSAGLLGKDTLPYLLLAFAFCGALATVTADTWATELGVLAQQQPRLITTGRPVPTGTSGGVTGRGMLAALAGSTLIGIAAYVLIQATTPETVRLNLGQAETRHALGYLGALSNGWEVILISAVSGFTGAAFDSLLGATVQAIYFCDACNSETERRKHRCGQVTQLMRGWRWLDNDWVNFLSSAAGALVAVALTVLFV